MTEDASPLGSFLRSFGGGALSGSPGADGHRSSAPSRAERGDRDPTGPASGSSGHRHRSTNEPSGVSLGLPLFAVDKVLATHPRGNGSNPAGSRGRHAGGTSTPPPSSSSGSFLSGFFGGVGGVGGGVGGPAGGGGGGDRTHGEAREFVAAACTSVALASPSGGAREGASPPARVFHAAAQCSEDGRKHHLLLRAVTVPRADGSGDAGGDEDDDTGTTAGENRSHAGPVLRALPWYEGPDARITSLAFSPPPAQDRLLCGTAGGAVYVIPSAALLGSGGAGGGAPPPSIQVLCSAGPPIKAALWWRRRGGDRGSLHSGKGVQGDARNQTRDVAIAAAGNGEVRFWDALSGAPLCAVCVGGRVESAELVDAGTVQYVLVAGDLVDPVSGRHSDRPEGGRGRVYWSLTLERGADLLPHAAGKPGFAPVLVRGRFGVGGGDGGNDFRWSNEGGDGGGDGDVHLSVHAGAGLEDSCSPLVASLNSSSATLTLFPGSDDLTPVSAHRVPPGTAAVHVTRRLIFALHTRNGSRRAHLAVIARTSKGKFSPLPSPSRSSAIPGSPAIEPAIVLQDIALSASAGSPRALMPSGQSRPGSLGLGWSEGLEGEVCVMWMAGAILECRPALPSIGAVFRGLLGVAEEDEAEAYANAVRHAGGRDSTRRRHQEGTSDGGRTNTSVDAGRIFASDSVAHSLGSRVVPPGGVFRGNGYSSGDAKAAILSAALQLDAAPLYLNAARDATRAGDIARARDLFARADNAPVAQFVSMCMEEWRAADALDHLAEDWDVTHGKGRDRAEDSGNGSPDDGRWNRNVAVSAVYPADELMSPDWLQLCCTTHLQLSAWAASTAAAALSAAVDFAEDHPDVDLPPLSLGAVPPPAAAAAAGELAEVCLGLRRDHPSERDLACAAHAARGAVDAATTVAGFLDACLKAGGDLPERLAAAASHLDLGGVTTPPRDFVTIVRSLLRTMLAAGCAVEVLHRAGRLERDQYVLNYTPPPQLHPGGACGGGIGGMGAMVLLNVPGVGRLKGKLSLFSAAMAAISTSLGGRPFPSLSSRADGGCPRRPLGAPAVGGRQAGCEAQSNGDDEDNEDCSVTALLPLMSAVETETLAAGAAAAAASGSGEMGAEEAHIAILLALSAAHRGAPRQQGVQRTLEVALRLGLDAGTVRADWAVAACLGWNNPRGAAVVFAARGAWLAAVRSRLRAVEPALEDLAKEHPHAASVEDIPRAAEVDPLLRHRVERELTGMMVELAVNPEVPREQGAAIGAVAEAWQRCHLSQERLERLILDNVGRSSSLSTQSVDGGRKAVGMDALLLLMERNRSMTRGRGMVGEELGDSDDRQDDENPGSAWDAALAATRREAGGFSPLTPLRFSATFALSVASLRVGTLKETSVASDSTSVNLLWSQIKGNLNKRLASSTAIRYDAPIVPPSAGAGTKVTRDAVDSWVFSCGHRYEALQMLDAAPRLQSWMTRAGLPLSGELLVADYALRRCALACPACATQAMEQHYSLRGRGSMLDAWVPGDVPTMLGTEKA